MPRETKQDRIKRTEKIFSLLRKQYPDAKCLEFSSTLELLVAVILSAQCTDKGVNRVTETLFKKYHTAAEFAAADGETFQLEIRPTGFFRNKTKSVLGACAKIVRDFGGEVPRTMDELLTLPEWRKTANVVLSSAFGKNEGLAVDTHVTRLANRLKLTAHEDNQGDRIENDLLELLPRRNWGMFSHLLIWHGRTICKARKPKCEICPLNKLCPSAFKVK